MPGPERIPIEKRIQTIDLIFKSELESNSINACHNWTVEYAGNVYSNHTNWGFQHFADSYDFGYMSGNNLVMRRRLNAYDITFKSATVDESSIVNPEVSSVKEIVQESAPKIIEQCKTIVPLADLQFDIKMGPKPNESISWIVYNNKKYFRTSLLSIPHEASSYKCAEIQGVLCIITTIKGLCLEFKEILNGFIPAGEFKYDHDVDSTGGMSFCITYNNNKYVNSEMLFFKHEAKAYSYGYISGDKLVMERDHKEYNIVFDLVKKPENSKNQTTNVSLLNLKYSTYYNCGYTEYWVHHDNKKYINFTNNKIDAKSHNVKSYMHAEIRDGNIVLMKTDPQSVPRFLVFYPDTTGAILLEDIVFAKVTAGLHPIANYKDVSYRCTVPFLHPHQQSDYSCAKMMEGNLILTSIKHGLVKFEPLSIWVDEFKSKINYKQANKQTNEIPPVMPASLPVASDLNVKECRIIEIKDLYYYATINKYIDGITWDVSFKHDNKTYYRVGESKDSINRNLFKHGELVGDVLTLIAIIGPNVEFKFKEEVKEEVKEESKPILEGSTQPMDRQPEIGTSQADKIQISELSFSRFADPYHNELQVQYKNNTYSAIFPVTTRHWASAYDCAKIINNDLIIFKYSGDLLVFKLKPTNPLSADLAIKETASETKIEKLLKQRSTLELTLPKLTPEEAIKVTSVIMIEYFKTGKTDDTYKENFTELCRTYDFTDKMLFDYLVQQNISGLVTHGAISHMFVKRLENLVSDECNNHNSSGFTLDVELNAHLVRGCMEDYFDILEGKYNNNLCDDFVTFYKKNSHWRTSTDVASDMQKIIKLGSSHRMHLLTGLVEFIA